LKFFSVSCLRPLPARADARADVETIGRILFFLRFKRPADCTTEQEWRLCEHLAANLRAKGEW
jgi:hypothetical protein